MKQILTRIGLLIFVLQVTTGMLVMNAAQAQSSSRRERISNGDRALVDQAKSVTGDDFPYSTTTPRGVRVFARAKPLPETLRAIDSGLSQLFVLAGRRNYRAVVAHSDYTVFIARADVTRDKGNNYSPGFAVPAPESYRGSVFDKGGVLTVAGMVLNFQPATFIIAEHDRDWQRISNVVSYEGEHIVLYHNDRPFYDRTLDHSKGGNHPILQ